VGNLPTVECERFEVTTADGRALEAVSCGDPGWPVVINHHGTPGSAHEFWPAHLDEAHARELRLVAYSRPGYAGSDRQEGRTVADCAADACAVADALGAQRFFTVGGSGGGPHALACAALAGDRVIAAATIAGVAPFAADGLDWFDGMGAENIEELEAARAGPEELERFVAAWEPQLREIAGPAVLQSLGDLVSPADAAVLTGDYADFAAAGIRDALSQGIHGWVDDDLALVADWGFDPDAIGLPVTIWQGLDDRFVPPAHGEWLAGHVGGAEGRLLDGEGHMSLGLASFGDILDGLLATSPT
jgi:pimeloyl-ACP methyl ester carboxylesterase